MDFNLFDISEKPEFTNVEGFSWYITKTLTEHLQDAHELTVGEPLNVVAWQMRKDDKTISNVFQCQDTHQIISEFSNL